jgi:hypothetical protein
MIEKRWKNIRSIIIISVCGKLVHLTAAEVSGAVEVPAAAAAQVLQAGVRLAAAHPVVAEPVLVGKRRPIALKNR